METINLKNYNIKDLLDKIESNAKEFENVSLALLDESFILKAIEKNTLVTRYFKKEYFQNNNIAFAIALLVDNHKDLIIEKLQEDDFYLRYIIEKIKNQDMNNKQTYINKVFFSKEENVLKVIQLAGFFKIKHIGDNLKDNEVIVNMFCENNKVNQIYASDRIKEQAACSGKKVSEYVKTKLFYQRLDEKFPHKHIQKATKI